MLTKTRKFSMILFQSSFPLLLALASMVPAHGDDSQSPSKTVAKPESIKATTRENKAGGSKPVSFMGDVAPILVRELYRLPQPQEVRKQVRDDEFHAACQGRKAGRGYHPCPRETRMTVTFLTCSGPTRNRGCPTSWIPCRQMRSSCWSGGWPKEPGTTEPVRPRTGRSCCARPRPSPFREAYPVTVPITALAFSPDGQQIAASGYHEITFWKTADGVLDHRACRALAERTYGIVYSGDGKWLATASGDPGQYGAGAALVARAKGRRQAGPRPCREPGRRLRRRLQPRQQAAGHRRRRPDHPGLGDRDRQARWCRSRITPTGSSISPSAPTASGSPAPAGTRRARSSTSVKKESLVTFPGHGQPVYTVAFNPDGKAVASGGEDNRSASGPRTTTAKQVREIGGFGGTVFKLQYTPDGKELVACSGDKSVRLFKARERFASCAPWRGTPTGSTRWRSRPTARRSPREAGTARSGSGTSPTASPSGPSSPHRDSRPMPAEAAPRGKMNAQASSSVWMSCHVPSPSGKQLRDRPCVLDKGE